MNFGASISLLPDQATTQILQQDLSKRTKHFSTHFEPVQTPNGGSFIVATTPTQYESSRLETAAAVFGVPDTQVRFPLSAGVNANLLVPIPPQNLEEDEDEAPSLFKLNLNNPLAQNLLKDMSALVPAPAPATPASVQPSSTVSNNFSVQA